MTPFDQAFALLKMPIVPGSLRNTSDEMLEQLAGKVTWLPELYDDFWEAQFEDPETGEIIPMKARTTGGPNYYENDPEMMAQIARISADMMNEANEEHDEAYDEDKDVMQPYTAKTQIQADWDTKELSPSAVWFPQQSNTQLEHRRKGYMTALYNMVQAILQRQKWGKLLPSSSQSHQAKGLWGTKDRWPKVPEELWQKEE